jgi:hypothetical protein
MFKPFLREQKNKRILDAGVGPVSVFPLLKEDNTVTEIDIRNGAHEDIRVFSIKENEYDVIICRNVLPFLSSKEEIFNTIEKLHQGATESVIFTVFGENDPWAKENRKMTFVNDDDVARLKEKYHLEKFEYFYGESKTMYGDTKLWEIYTFIIKK